MDRENWSSSSVGFIICYGKRKKLEYITDIGLKILNGWQTISERYGLKIVTSGLPSLASFEFVSEDNLKYKTFITQEMLKDFLASDTCYSCLSHNDKILNDYFENLEETFSFVKDFELGKDNVENKLKGDICHQGFKRLN